MTPQQKLVRFMEIKQSLFKGLIKEKYITKAIEKDMLSWSEEEASFVLSKLLSSPLLLLTAMDCPYCKLMKGNYGGPLRCDICFYGKVRGQCGRRDSVYNKYYKIKKEHTDLIRQRYSLVADEIKELLKPV